MHELKALKNCLFIILNLRIKLNRDFVKNDIAQTKMLLALADYYHSDLKDLLCNFAMLLCLN